MVIRTATASLRPGQHIIMAATLAAAVCLLCLPAHSEEITTTIPADCASSATVVTNTNGNTKQTVRVFSHAGKTQMGTQGSINRAKPRKTVSTDCNPTPKPKPTIHTGRPNNFMPGNSVNVQTTIINGANGNQVIVNQVSVPNNPPLTKIQRK